MGEPVRTRKGKLAGRGGHDARLGRVVQVKKGAEEIRSFELSGKEMKRNRKKKRTKRTRA